MTLVASWSLRFSRKILVAAILALALTLLLWRNRSEANFALLHQIPQISIEKPGSHRPQSAGSKCPLQAEYLRSGRFGLTDNIVLHRQCIRATTSNKIDRDTVTDVSDNFFGPRQNLNLISECDGWKPMACEPIELEVPPAFPEEQHPELMFGVATTYNRLIDSAGQLSHWLSNSGCRIVAIVVDASQNESELTYLLNLYRDLSIELVVVLPQYQNLGANEQHFTIIHDMIRHMKPETKWFGIIDDDTFFPSLYPLAEVLAQQNHSIPQYFGGLSDSMHNVQENGLMAYGGAGAFLSVPLAQQLEPHIEDCLVQSNSNQGDALLKFCIYSHTETRLMLLPGLNQLDMLGDASGFYESGRSPLSLHHWKSWHRAPVDQMAKSVDMCGSCFLQRWRFGKDTVLSNGYSVAVYDGGIGMDDLGATEGTFDDPDRFEWSYGPLRPKVDAAKKKAFILADAEKIDGKLRQVYVKRGGGRPRENDEVLELWWEKK